MKCEPLGCAMFTEKHREISPEFLHASVLLLCKVGHEAVSVHLQKTSKLFFREMKLTSDWSLAILKSWKEMSFISGCHQLRMFFLGCFQAIIISFVWWEIQFPSNFSKAHDLHLLRKKMWQVRRQHVQSKNTSWQLGPLLDCFFVWKTWMSLVIRNYPNKKNWYHLYRNLDWLASIP